MGDLDPSAPAPPPAADPSASLITSTPLRIATFCSFVAFFVACGAAWLVLGSIPKAPLPEPPEAAHLSWPVFVNLVIVCPPGPSAAESSAVESPLSILCAPSMPDASLRDSFAQSFLAADRAKQPDATAQSLNLVLSTFVRRVFLNASAHRSLIDIDASVSVDQVASDVGHSTAIHTWLEQTLDAAQALGAWRDHHVGPHAYTLAVLPPAQGATSAALGGLHSPWYLSAARAAFTRLANQSACADLTGPADGTRTVSFGASGKTANDRALLCGIQAVSLIGLSASHVAHSTFLRSLRTDQPSTPAHSVPDQRGSTSTPFTGDASVRTWAAHARLCVSFSLVLADSSDHSAAAAARDFAAHFTRPFEPLFARLRAATATRLDMDSQVVFDGALPLAVAASNASDGSVLHSVPAMALADLVGQVPWLRMSTASESESETAAAAVESDVDLSGRERVSAVASAQTLPLNIVYYVPAARHSPLYVRASASASTVDAASVSPAFLVPRFGGVVFANGCGAGDASSLATCTQQSAPFAMALLRGMLGVGAQLPQSTAASRPSYSSRSPTSIPFQRDFYSLPSALGVADWEVDAIARAFAAERHATIASRLLAAHALLAQVSAIPVSNEVAARFRSAHAALHAARKLTRRATNAAADANAARAANRNVDASQSAVALFAAAQADLSAAASHLGDGAAAAEAALFDASLLPLTYFPDQHVAIVFASFFVPVVLPVLVAVAQHVKAARQIKQSLRADAAGAAAVPAQ